MHSTITAHKGDGGKWRHFVFLHHGDYGGEVIIREVADDSGNPKLLHEMSVPFEALQELVAGWVRSQKIQALEQASDKKILLD